MFAEGEEQNGLGVGVELGEFGLEVDATHQRGVEAVCAGAGWLASWRGVVAGSAATERGALLLPVFETDAGYTSFGIGVDRKHNAKWCFH
jgi:hypothetical protein